MIIVYCNGDRHMLRPRIMPLQLVGKVINCASHREIRGRGVAMTSRTIIGHAEGILMERLGIDADQAFAYLRRVSQSENRKLIMICSEIVKTLWLPQ
jgi:hypothetical protein